MKDSSLIVIYGSYGYTGKLIVNECRRKNHHVILSGRNESELKRQSEESGYPYKVVASDDLEGLKKLLEPAVVVIHCGGPFKHTAKTMSDACLATQTHYTDITGEYQVFEYLAGLDHDAKNKGITIMPGVGFDVVPSDCLALHLKKKLPDATHLQLAFTMSKGGLSRGTKKSMTEGLGYGCFVRQNGKLAPIPLGSRSMEIDFGPFKTLTMCIPWGDISTAWRSTEIPNIEVYTGATPAMLKNAKRSNWLGWLFRMGWVKKMMLDKIDKEPAGPTEEKLKGSKSYLWGKIWNSSGTQFISRMETISGYPLTAKTAVLIAEKIITGHFKIGYQTPSMAYSSHLILEIEGTVRHDEDGHAN